MFRTITAAAIVFSSAAFALHKSTLLSGRLEEPLLLLFMGTLFLVVGKLFSAPVEKKPVPAAQLVERRAA